MSERNNSGALPTLDSTEDVLGVPQSRDKSKTNVGKFWILVFILGAFLFLIVALLVYQKNRTESQPANAVKPVEKPAFTTKNNALEDASIESAKAELKKKDDEEKARRELEAAQAAAAAAEEAAREEEARKLKQLKRGQTASTPDGEPVTEVTQERKSAVLLELNGAHRKPGERLATSRDQEGSGAATLPKDFASRMAAVGAPEGKTGSGGGLGGNGENLEARLRPTVLQARFAGRLPNLSYLLKRGTSIPCALKTGIDTTLPGFVICNVLNDVYSANGKTLLVERGATVFGEQQSGLKQGQERTFVLWTRIDNPSGVFADIDSPATDQMGYSGIPGYVDTHFWARFGGAIMLSLIKDYSAALSQRTAGANSNGANYNNTQQATQDMSAEALRSTINIPPTLTVLPGTVVNVLVARDVSFENVYDTYK